MRSQNNNMCIDPNFIVPNCYIVNSCISEKEPKSSLFTFEYTGISTRETFNALTKLLLTMAKREEMWIVGAGPHEWSVKNCNPFLAAYTLHILTQTNKTHGLHK